MSTENSKVVLRRFVSAVMPRLAIIFSHFFLMQNTIFAQETLAMLVEESTQAAPQSDSLDQLVKRLEEAESRLNMLEWERQQLIESDAEEVEPEPEKPAEKPEPKKDKAWYEKLRVRGYTQVRINDVLDTEDGSAPAQYIGDSSVGENQGFIIRRARVILQGDVSDHVSIYLQPDFASNVPGSSDANQYTQIRDWYADLDKTRVNRIRVGQSKIPFGWETCSPVVTDRRLTVRTPSIRPLATNVT